MAERNQDIPLVLAASRSSDEDVTPALGAVKTLRPRIIFLICCGASIFLLAIIIAILAFTVFKVKEPTITVNSYRITSIDLINNTTPKPGTNVSIISDVSVKNANAMSFSYGDTTTTIYYHGAFVGEARELAGHMRARRTKRMNVTVDIIADNIMSSPYLSSDMRSGIVRVNTYSTVPGRLTVLKVKKHVVAKVKCSIIANITAPPQTMDVKCKWHVKI